MGLLTIWGRALATVAVAISVNATVVMNPAMAGFPEKPITMVLGSTPGSAPDTLGRIVAERMANVLGQPVVVENKQGANGSIAATQVAQADPDEYTLMLATAVHSITPTTRNDLKYDFEKDFRGVGMMVLSPLLILISILGWFDSRSPLFQQERVGKKPKVIHIGEISNNAARYSVRRFTLCRCFSDYALRSISAPDQIR